MASNQTTEAIRYGGPSSKVDYTPSGADVANGEIIQQGNLIGVAIGDIPDGEKGTLDTDGIYKVAKDNVDTFSAGAKVSWDDTNKQAEPNGGVDESFKLGVAVKAAVAGDDYVLTKINHVTPT